MLIYAVSLPISGADTLSGRMSYHNISWRLEAARFDVIMFVSLCNFTGISAAEKYKPESRGFETSTRSCDKTSVCLVSRLWIYLEYLRITQYYQFTYITTNNIYEEVAFNPARLRRFMLAKRPFTLRKTGVLKGKSRNSSVILCVVNPLQPSIAFYE